MPISNYAATRLHFLNIDDGVALPRLFPSFFFYFLSFRIRLPWKEKNTDSYLILRFICSFDNHNDRLCIDHFAERKNDNAKKTMKYNPGDI